MIKKLIYSMVLLAAVSVGGLHAGTITIEAEDGYAPGKGYNNANCTIEIGEEATYSGGQYVEITAGNGDIPLELTNYTAGDYTAVFYYTGYANEWNDSNNFWNLYYEAGHTADADEGKVNGVGGKIDNVPADGKVSVDFTLPSDGTYYIALYSENGTTFDKVDILQGDALLEILEAENCTDKGYKGDGFTFSKETAVETYSGGKYVRIGGDTHGEIAVAFTIQTAGLYTIEFFYEGFDGSNIHYNIYGESGWDNALPNEGKLIDGGNINIEGYGNNSYSGDFEPGTYYIALYGNPGTLFDKVELTSDQILGIGNNTADEVSIRFDNGILITTAEVGFEYAIYNSAGNLLIQGQSAGATTTVDTQLLPAGIYIVNVNAGGKQLAKKVSIY